MDAATSQEGHLHLCRSRSAAVADLASEVDGSTAAAGVAAGKVVDTVVATDKHECSGAKVEHRTGTSPARSRCRRRLEEVHSQPAGNDRSEELVVHAGCMIDLEVDTVMSGVDELRKEEAQVTWEAVA